MSLGIDEINALRAAEIKRLDEIEAKWKKVFPQEIEPEDLWEDIYTYLLWEYLNGTELTETVVIANEVLRAKFETAIAKSIEGKTAEDRVKEYARAGAVRDAVTVAKTEGNRMLNAGIVAVAKPKAKKTWHTMLDERVRDTHDYLEGMTVDIDKAFYTYNGDYAMYPGDFALAYNNVNCRCWITTGVAKEGNKADGLNS